MVGGQRFERWTRWALPASALSDRWNLPFGSGHPAKSDHSTQKGVSAPKANCEVPKGRTRLEEYTPVSTKKYGRKMYIPVFPPSALLPSPSLSPKLLAVQNIKIKKFGPKPLKLSRMNR